MEYTHATLLLHESGEEINEANLTAVLEAAGCSVTESRVKALVAALEEVDLDSVSPDPDQTEAIDSPPATGSNGSDENESQENGDSSQSLADQSSDDAPGNEATE